MRNKLLNMPKRVKGYVKWFDYKKGYDFITVDDKKDVFIHFSNINMEGFKKLDDGDEAELEIKESEDNKGPEALNVKILVKDKRYL